MRRHHSEAFLIRALPRLFHITPVLMGLFLASPAEGQWPIKEFEVVSAEDLLPFAPAFNAFSEQLDEWLQAWGMEPTGARIYVPDPEIKREIEDYLTEASGLLEHWGFPPPDLPALGGRYQVTLAAETASALKGETAAGTYHPSICGVIGGHLFLSADAILGDGGEEGEDHHLTPYGRVVLAHELFHAVQGNTAFLGSGCPPVAGSWIVEGTADAIGFDVLRRLRGEEAGRWVQAWGGRDYSERLPVPFVFSLLPRDWSDERLAAYHTSSLWRYLAEYYASLGAGGGMPGPEPPGQRVDYRYLASMLMRGRSSDDCSGADAACGHELRWLDAGLRSIFARTLREVYPLFAETLALYGDHRVDGAWNSGRTWRNTVFHECSYFELTPQPLGRVHREVIPSFEPVSTHCWTILVPQFGNGVPVEVTVEGPPGGFSLADLSTAVAGPPIRADSAVVQTAAGTEKLSTRWIIDLPPDRENHFVLTNVAHDPAATTRMRNLPITFTALDPFATITSINSTPGPSGADIDQPIEVRFDRGLQGVVTDAAALYPRDPGLAEPCILRVQGLSNPAGDQLSFGMDLEGPIGPDEYPVANGAQVEYQGRDPWPPGMPVVHFGLGPGNPLSGGAYQAFLGTAGTLTVTSVSGRFVQGVLDVSGENRLAKRIALGDSPPPVYVPNATIRVEFGLVMRDPGDPVNDSGVIGCLSSETPGGQAKGVSGGPPSDSPGMPSDTSSTPEKPAEDSSGAESGGSGRFPEETRPEPGADPTTGPAEEAEAAAHPSEAAGDALGPGGTRWVSVRAEGRPDLSFHGSDVDGSAGADFSCYGAESPAFLSLYEGASGQTASLGLNVVTATGIAQGATGTYRIDQVQYIVDGGSLGWRGPANLELWRQDASKDPGARRVTGRIVGLNVLDRETRAVIPIEAEFDVNAACVPFGRQE